MQEQAQREVEQRQAEEAEAAGKCPSNHMIEHFRICKKYIQYYTNMLYYDIS